ncbi:nucleoside triphosphate pyrophosphohydrolase [Enterovirga aerilata]|uniref:Nucleoside triphosphate pyrophosphohydrolase n=1 Tax=Enterovirga aerilata TaxID=2730920 RepID=A0A849I379_9HYPH|nr:nucleoside triphosphate pyrophosphohydrolase [Enterovirga sp. DB1703]NNM72094.1 nucleoside triphosphate pyrophosphohydrolase [Enterovirga sp. DB1703]
MDRGVGAPFEPRPSRDVAMLLAIMAALRDPETGCPWDIEQSFETIAPYTVEEAYEVADAIARGDLAELRDELGDLLLQVVFHARMAEERGAFDFGGVVEAITAKLIRRHPHVFGAARDLAPAEVKRLWDEIKAAEKRERADRQGGEDGPASILDGVPAAMPSLTRADKLTRRAARVGFEWPDLDGVTAKIEEELAEVREAAAGGDKADLAEEVGDLLFTVANLARHLDIDPEAALARANRKFERRFRAVERALEAAGRTPEQSDLAEMDRLWEEAKAAERAGGPEPG